MKRRPHYLRVVVTFLCLACSNFVTESCFAQIADRSATDNYYPTNDWRTAHPEEQALNKRILKSLLKRIRKNKIRDIDSLLIVRNGYLVTEEYFRGYDTDSLHTLQSDTKSITSLLVGIAMQQGRIQNVNDHVLPYFPEYPRIRNRDDRKENLRIQDLLTMRTGLDWSESNYPGSPLQQLNTCQCDWLKFVLDWQMLEEPGRRFEYNSGGVILLGGIVRNATGIAVDEFAQQFLFEPLGIRQVRWVYGEPDNLPHMGGGLFMRPRDMAKIGYLLLRKGRWEDKQVVSESWLAESLQHWVRNPRTFHSFPTDYGYLWWLLPLDGTGNDRGDDADIYTACGAQGQYIFAIPRYDMVVVVTANASDFVTPIEFLYSDILPAVQ